MDNNYPSELPPLKNLWAEDETIDIRRYFGLFLSNWYWFAVVLFLSGLLAYAINTYSEKVFTVSSSLLVGSNVSSDMTGLDRIVPGGDIIKSQANLQNEIGILRSFSLNKRVMSELPDFHITVVEIGRRGIAQKRHYKSEPFVVILSDDPSYNPPGVPVNIRIRSAETYTLEINGQKNLRKELRFGERFNESGFDFTIYKRDRDHFVYDPNFLNRFVFWFNNNESLANTYRGKLGINPINEESSLVTLSVSGAVPLQEADYLNKLMDVYIRQGLEFKNQTADKTIEFIDRQLALISDSLTKAEDRLENFRLSNQLIDLSSEGNAIKNKLERYSQEKITTTLQKQYFEYLENYIRTKDESGDIISPSVMGVTDQVLLGLVNALQNLQVQKEQLKFNFSKDQPSLDFINSKIEEARAALSENVKSCITNVNRVLNDIDSRISSVENDLNRLPGTERRMINIQRKFDLNNTVYTYMLEKRSEAGIARASNVSGSRIIDHAEAFNSARIKPTERKNYLFAILFGILVPGIYIFLIDQLHNKILDKKDIEKGTQVPIIGYIGHSSSKDAIPVTARPGSSLSESFRTVRTNLKYYFNQEKKAVISITSTISGEGKTFISLNLAAILAMVGKKTLLVGVDLRKPKLDKILGMGTESGLSTYLIGETTFADLVQKTDVENLFFVPTGPTPPNPAELLETEKMNEFMKRMREEYDFIVLDTPPIGIVSDAMLLGSYADMNIFVIRQRFSFKSTLELIQNIFKKKGLKNLTIAVNDINISGYYGYGLRYGYGFYEGYGYNYGYGRYGSYYHGDHHKYYDEE